ncbi:E3 ubiquitin-protein ligase TRIM39-like [Lissotriton helveticus]
MAASSQLRSLKEEATCSICLEYFTDPVSVECGHTFCLSCITQYWEGLQTDFPCPQCRDLAQNKTLRPNRHLANMVETLKQFQIPTATTQEANLCREHEEKLKLFCEDDQEPVCVVCSMSRDHTAHKMLPIGEAAQEYKGKFWGCLNPLKRKLSNMLELQRKEETEAKQIEAKFKSKREQITNEFEKLQEFLEQEKSRHISSLEEEEKKCLQSIKEKVTQLEEQQSVLKSLITEIESKCQQQEVDLLKDVKSTLRRYENMKAQHMAYGIVKEKEEKIDEKEEVDLPIKILQSLEWRWARRFAAEVTLDPDTVNRWLILSEDGKRVRPRDRAQEFPEMPQRFKWLVAVLGIERLCAGKHYWEVEVDGKIAWSLGICNEYVTRDTVPTLSPEEGFWTVWFKHGKYEARTSPPTLLTPRVAPRAVGLFLDYEMGRFSVYNVDDRSLLFTFSGASFPNTLLPFFSPGLHDRGKNTGALQILPVNGWD